MASTSNKAKPSTQAEIVLNPSLKNCLVNLPSSLVGLLLNSNAVVQNVVAELAYTQSTPATGDDKGNAAKTQKSVFLGWTGMRSQTRMGSLVARERSGRQDQEVPTVEIDSTYAKLVGLTDGMKVSFEMRSLSGTARQADAPQ